MGDRSHIVIQAAGAPNIVLYGHWAGARNREAVIEAEIAGARMKGDPAYLTASLFHFFTKDQYDGVMSYGIWSQEDVEPGDLDCDVPPVYVNADTGEYRSNVPYAL